MNKNYKNISYKVVAAVNSGKLKKTNCVECGSSRLVQGHHEDYDKPLEVIWLCSKCHHKLHQARKPLVDTDDQAIRIDPITHKKLKIRAAKMGITLKRVVEILTDNL